MRCITSVLAVLALLLTASISIASEQDQPRKTNPTDPDIELPENPYLSYSKPREWKVRQTIYLLLPQGIYLDRHDRVEVENYGSFPEQIEFVYPHIKQSGASWSDPDEKPTGKVVINDRPQELEYTVGYAQGSNAPYTRWGIDISEHARVLRFDFFTNVVSVDTKFDEQAALQLGWPEQWPDEPAGFLSPIIDSLGEPFAPHGVQVVDPITVKNVTPPIPVLHDETVITDLVSEWTEGNDPKSIPPVQLAKFLTGKVLEHLRSNDRSLLTPNTSGFNKALSHNNEPGGSYNFAYTGFYAGFAVRHADEVAIERRGSRHDVTVLLTSVLRAAGLPARTVIGIDNEESGIDRILSWVEFAIYDPDLDLTVWVPVDPDELRGRGARSSQYDRPWKFFGTNDRLHAIAPVSFYFHPPAAYQSFEVPALYGIRSEQELPFFAEQIITFGINRKPVRGGQTNQNQTP